MSNEAIIYVMDMESSLSDALIRRVIDMGQYCTFRKWDMEIDAAAETQALAGHLKGIILSGSAKNVNGSKTVPPSIPAGLLETGVPILAICYGMQYLAHLRGIEIVRCWDEQDPKKRSRKGAAKKDSGEQGPTQLTLTPQGRGSLLFQGLAGSFPVWMKHNWMASGAPEGWTVTSSTAKCPVASMEFGNIFATQFHPEPFHSLFGRTILHNFLTYACGVETPYY